MDRFWNKVDKTNRCWNWTGCGVRAGYGQFWFKGKMRLAHRLSAYFAGIITGLQDERHVMHTCDNPSCVRPDHLIAGTNKDNHKDKAVKGRAAKGERNSKAKLTANKVRAIRADNRSQRELAKVYGVSQVAIGKIKRRQHWRHIV